LDLDLNFDPTSGVSSDCTQDESVPIDGLNSYTILVFIILIDNQKFSGLAQLNTFWKGLKDTK